MNRLNIVALILFVIPNNLITLHAMEDIHNPHMKLAIISEFEDKPVQGMCLVKILDDYVKKYEIIDNDDQESILSLAQELKIYAISLRELMHYKYFGEYMLHIFQLAESASAFDRFREIMTQIDIDCNKLKMKKHKVLTIYHNQEGKKLGPAARDMVKNIFGIYYNEFKYVRNCEKYKNWGIGLRHSPEDDDYYLTFPKFTLDNQQELNNFKCYLQTLYTTLEYGDLFLVKYLGQEGYSAHDKDIRLLYNLILKRSKAMGSYGEL